MLKIIKYPDTFLRKASQPINRFDGDLKEMPWPWLKLCILMTELV